MWEGWSRRRKTRGTRCRKNLRERREREKERRAAAALGAVEELGPGEEQPPFLPTLFHGIRRRGVGDGYAFLLFFLWLSDMISYVF